MDGDSGSNSDLVFSLDPSAQGLFTLQDTGPFSTRLLIDHSLDREAVDSYTFRVFAMDGGSPALAGSTLININVIVSL